MQKLKWRNELRRLAFHWPLTAVHFTEGCVGHEMKKRDEWPTMSHEDKCRHVRGCVGRENVNRGGWQSIVHSLQSASPGVPSGTCGERSFGDSRKWKGKGKTPSTVGVGSVGREIEKRTT